MVAWYDFRAYALGACGGTGRRGGLKIRFFGVWVRVPPGARNLPLYWVVYSLVAQLADAFDC